MNKKIIIAIIFTSFTAAVSAQKGETSISAGPLFSFPISNRFQNDLSLGVGVEATLQYNLSQKSALLLQLDLASYSLMNRAISHDSRLSLLSIKGGYRYQFINSAFYGNVLAGITQSYDGYMAGCLALGAGKRFIVKDIYFIDAGLDYITGDQDRINIKAAFSLLQRPKRKSNL